MNEDEIFTTWGDLDDGKESVWGADWAIDPGQEKSTVFVTITYKSDEEFICYYNDIEKAFDSGTVNEYVSKFVSEKIAEEDIKEITDFFFHWLQIVDAGGSTDIDIADEDIIEISED